MVARIFYNLVMERIMPKIMVIDCGVYLTSAIKSLSRAEGLNFYFYMGLAVE